MPKPQLYDSSVFKKFFQPLGGLFCRCANTRKCPEVPDEEWVAVGLSRVLRPDPSGRAFLQSLADIAQHFLGRSNFFESLKSKRRLKFLGELLGLLCRRLEPDLPDSLAQYTELKDFDVYAGDGHYLAAAAHDAHKDGSKYAMGHFFALNLRNHLMRHLCGADQDNRKKEHDMRALKRLSVEQLRLGAAVGRKVIYAWDKAGIDFHQWYQWKRSGIYFVSLEKENMTLDISGVLPVDQEDPINIGVLSCELVSGIAGILIRRIIYRCPIEGTVFELLTSEMQLSPGLIVLIYKMRWDVEKTFDETKNRWMERKCWASSATAKTIQALFVCLTHNLALLLDHRVEQEEGICNEPEIRRREQRMSELEEIQESKGEPLPQWYRGVQRMTQRGVKFIRWLRNHHFLKVPWEQAVASLERIYRYS